MIKLYKGKTIPTFDPNVYIKVDESSEGLKVQAVTRDGLWIKHLFTLTKDRGIVRNYAASNAGFPVDSDGRISVSS